MNKTKVLICGASGFIGRNLFQYFSSRDKYDTYGTYFTNRQSYPANRFFKADLKNKGEALWVTKDMDIVINAAAMTDGIGAYSGKEDIFKQNNDLINANVIEATHVNGVKHCIYLSCTVMYHSSTIPLKEEEFDPIRTHPKYSLLAQMKLFGEESCRHFASLGNTKYTVARHTNIYGPHDKFDLKRGHVLAATIVKVMQAQKNLTVWGSGKESRDFLYIEDLIEFINLAITHQKNNFDVFNVSYGQSTSINELVEKIIDCSGKKLEVAHDPEKPTIETHMSINSDKANELLGWKAKTKLSEGLKLTLDWYRNQPR